MSVDRKAADNVQLPDWIQILEDTCGEHITKSWTTALAAELWRENGFDLILKIRQLMAEVVRLQAIVDRLPRDANGATYTHGDVLRLTTDSTIRAEAVVCLVPLDDCGLASYCTLAGVWEIDSTEQAARGAKEKT